MFCNKCGNQIPEGAKFCPVCGAPKAAPQPEAQQPWPQQPWAQQQPYPQQPQQPWAQQPYQQQQYQQQPYAPPPVEDVPNKGLNFLSFFIPIIGFVIYATSHQQTPIKAKAALKMSIIGICVWVGAVIFFSVLGVVIPMMLIW